MDMPLNEAQRVLENVTTIFTAPNTLAALARVRSIVAESAGLEQYIGEQRRRLEEIAAEIARRKTEALDLAAKSVDAEAAHAQQVKEYDTLTAALRYTLGKLQEEHAALLTTQQAEWAEARSVLRKQYEAESEDLAGKIHHLKAEHETLAKGLAALRAKIA